MVYLDYAANTPVSEEVLACFTDVSRKYIANPNSAHTLGRAAKEQMDEITKSLAACFGVQPQEVIYTSGASEANNMAIKGIVNASRRKGKHIISTCLEHSSVSGTLTYLQEQGYEIDLVDLLNDGRVDLDQLKSLLRDDTILVTIGYVDSELGIRQPIEEIGKLLEAYPNCSFHTDATQAVGKIPVDFSLVDCATFAPHKFFGLNGAGVLIKKEAIKLEPLIHGGMSTTPFRSGTPTLALSAATYEAVKLALESLEERFKEVKTYNESLQNFLKTYNHVNINSTQYSIPYILNVSVRGIKASKFQAALEAEGIYVSTKSACSVMSTPSRSVLAVTKDKKNAFSSWRISLSHLNTKEELDTFMKAFDRCYKALTNA